MRFISWMTALGVICSLGACAAIPDSAAGVGFDNSLNAPRTAPAAAGTALPPPQAVSDEVLPPAASVPGAGADPVQLAAAQALGAPQGQQDIIRDASAALDAANANSGIAPLQASPSNPAPPLLGNPGLSDENDFAAVSGRQTIESDAARIAQNRAQYQVVTPTAVPTRSGAAQPNIVQYALETRHPRGTKVWQRLGLNLASRAQRACAEFPSADQAQIAFLEGGGPQRDRRGLDPDGDGYACAWDPAPFRAAVQN